MRASLLSLDVTAVVLFVVLGRNTHDEASTIAGVVETAAPFLIGLVAGWLAARAWREPGSIRTGLIVWSTTLVVGMVLRRVVFDDGTALPFVIVATLTLGALLIGWRLVGSLQSSIFSRRQEED